MIEVFADTSYAHHRPIIWADASRLLPTGVGWRQGSARADTRRRTALGM